MNNEIEAFERVVSMMPILMLGFLVMAVFFALTQFLVGESLGTSNTETLKGIKRTAFKLEEQMETILNSEWAQFIIANHKHKLSNRKTNKEYKKMNEVFLEELYQYKSNHREYKQLYPTDESIESAKENATIISNALESQLNRIHSMGTQLADLIKADMDLQKQKDAEKLAEKMKVELSNEEKVDIVIKETRSHEEVILQKIIENKDVAEEHKKRAQELLPHFQGKTQEEIEREKRDSNIELDLQTLEMIAGQQK